MQEQVKKRRIQRGGEENFPEWVKEKVFYDYGDVADVTSRLENEGYKCADIRSIVLGMKDYTETVTIGDNPVWFNYLDLGSKPPVKHYFLCLKPGEKVGVRVTGSSPIGNNIYGYYDEIWEFRNENGEVIGKKITASY